MDAVRSTLIPHRFLSCRSDTPSTTSAGGALVELVALDPRDSKDPRDEPSRGVDGRGPSGVLDGELEEARSRDARTWRYADRTNDLVRGRALAWQSWLVAVAGSSAAAAMDSIRMAARPTWSGKACGRGRQRFGA